LNTFVIDENSTPFDAVTNLVMMRSLALTGTNNDTNKNHKKCMLQLFGKKGKRNPMFAANAHPRIFKKDPAWQVLAQQNELDIQLYESVVEVFQEQKKEMKQWTKLA